MSGRPAVRDLQAEVDRLQEARDLLRAWESTFGSLPDGIRAVPANGRVVVEDGAHLGERPGEVLRAG